MIRHPRRYFPQTLGLVICSTLVAAALCGCHTAKSTTEPSVIEPLAEQSFSRGWTQQLSLQPGDTVKSIYVYDESVHVMSTMNFDFAFKRAGGDLLYFSPVATPKSDLHGGPILLKDTIAYPTTFTIELFNKRGRFMKTIPLNFTVTSGGVGAEDMLYVGSAENNGEISAIGVKEPYNTVRWSLMAMGTVSSAPAIIGDIVYFASADGSVRASTPDRAFAWPTLPEGRYITGGRIVADLKVDKFNVYVASTDKRLYALNHDTGKLKWQYFADAPLEIAPDITTSSVYQYVSKVGLVALNKTETLDIPGASAPVENPRHTPRWIAPMAVKYLAEDDKFTYALGTDNHIIALDKKTGEKMFESKRTDFVVFGANNKNGTIYAATKNGQLMAIEPILKPGVHGELVLDVETNVRPILASSH